MKIVLSSRTQADLEQAVAHLKERGAEAGAIAIDLSKESAVEPLVAEAIRHLSHIDILVTA